MKWDNQLINHLQWSNAIINREGKEIVAREIAAMAEEGDVIGAGSGSTVYLTLFALAERIRKESLHIEVIPASAEISNSFSKIFFSGNVFSTYPKIQQPIPT